MTKKKEPPKDANEMSDEELMRSVFPPHVVERIEREIGVFRNNSEEDESEENKGDERFTPSE